MPAVHARKDKMIAGLTGGIEMLFKKNKIDWIKGTARLTGGQGVEVTLHDGTKQSLTATKEIIVATGSAPRSVPGIEVDRKKIIFSDEAIHLPEVPKTIAIMGSGAVGVEFASIFRSYGSEVTVIELLPRLVPGEDEAVSAELEKTSRSAASRCMTGTKVTAAKAGAKGVDIEMHERRTARRRSSLSRCCSWPPAAARSPKASAPRSSASRWIAATSSSTRCSGPTCRASPRSATSSRWAGRTTSSRTSRRWRASCWPSASPATRCSRSTTTTCRAAPTASRRSAASGLTEAQAKAQGHDVRIGSFPFSALARARMAGETDGFVKIVAEKKYDEVLGVHIIGPRATELVAEAVLALRLEVHGRGAGQDDSRAPDDVGGGG